jgi:hypothetical protein
MISLITGATAYFAALYLFKNVKVSVKIKIVRH